LSSGAANPFQPIATVTMASATVSANVQLAGSGESLLVTNPTSSLAFVRFGSDPTVQATTSDTPVLPNSKVLLHCGPIVSYCAAVLSSGSGAIMFTRGSGSGI
jgi:hypothetical protein